MKIYLADQQNKFDQHPAALKAQGVFSINRKCANCIRQKQNYPELATYLF
jgi:hypothetical protein